MLEVLVIGAGFSGLAMIPRLRSLGLQFRVIEAGSDVGGTWYWNRYPGARTDSEAWYYCYSTDKELLDSWDWSERYPSQPEVLRYLRHVAERDGYYQHITFNSKMQRAEYAPDARAWTVTTSAGETIRAKNIVLGLGVLSEPYLPAFKGIEQFGGEWYRTGRWPKQEPDFRGKKVAVIGTGATGVQLIPIVAEQAAQLTVFQRTANYIIPAQNHPLGEEQRKRIREDYDAIWAKVRSHAFGMPFEVTGRRAVEATAAEREAVFEECWQRGGFRYLFETYDDILVDAAANEHAAEFIRQKIRQTVKNPVTAELLCPKDHPYGGKRPPGSHGYFETFNRENVHLVDVKTNPIAEITATGIRLHDGSHFDADVIIFATGFDGYTGAFTAVDIVGEKGVSLREHWRQGPRNFLGLMVSGFPNLFFVNGPLVPFANNPPIVEVAADAVTRLLAYQHKNHLETIGITRKEEDFWIKEAVDRANETLVPLGNEANNWGAGANIPGKAVAILHYMGGLAKFSELINQEIAEGFPHFEKHKARTAKALENA
jgi:cyclohexanone monooxygenase